MIMSKIKNFLNSYFYKSYHRPSAKFEHILTIIKKLFYNKKSFVFAERIFLEKNPPSSMQYYNLLGRIIFYLVNAISILLFSKFLSKSTHLDTDRINKSAHFEGNDDEPWPPQSDHFFENKNNLNSVNFDELYLNYNESISSLKKNDIFKENEWWKSCREEFKNFFIINNKINIDQLKNFRNNIDTKAEILNDQNFLSKNLPKKINQLRSLSLINLYHKLSEVVDLSILRSASESFAGNNYCLNYRGQRLSYRVMRYAYYASQIKNSIEFNKINDGIVLDLGGGYGGLARTLKNYYRNSTIIIIELPELCLLSYYYLKSCFPEKKIGQFLDFKDNSITRENIRKYDFVIIPPSFFDKIENHSIDLSINTTSIGEMTQEMQKFYIQNIERTSQFFYSVNRAKKRIEKYNSNGFYDIKFENRWRALIYKFTHTYHIEFMGEKIK